MRFREGGGQLGPGWARWFYSERQEESFRRGKCQHVMELVMVETSRESHGNVWAGRYVCPATLQWGCGLRVMVCPRRRGVGRESVVEDFGWLEGCGGE